MEKQTRQAKVGDVVIFHDPVGKPSNALVTAAWSETCVNIVIVSEDPEKRDSYGRQIERHTSLMHGASLGAAYGMYWRWPDETPNPIKPPVSV